MLHYEIDANGRHDDPAIILVKKAMMPGCPGDATDLLIVSGPLTDRHAALKAVQLAARHTGPSLRIAVCRRGLDDQDDGPGPATASPALFAAFDAVFVTGPSDTMPVRRLVRTLTAPDDACDWIGAEWSEVHHLITTAQDSRPAPYGFGAASQENGRSGLAEAAYAAAIAHLERHGPCLHDAKGVCVAVMTSGPALPGKEALEVVTRLRAAMHPAGTLIQCLAHDATLAPGTLDVSVFAFGQHDAAHAITPLGQSGQVPESDLYQQARALVLQEGRASVSLIQRRLRIGYRQAACLLDAMAGDVLTPSISSNQHKVSSQ